MYGTARRSAHAVVASMGATLIDYEHADFVEGIRRLSGDGVDIVFDGIGGAHVWRSFKSLRPGGKVVAYGLTSTLRGGTLARGRRHRFRRVATIGFFIAAAYWLPGRRRVWPYSIQRLKRRKPAFFRADLAALMELLRVRAIQPMIADRIPLQDVRRAHERLGSGSVSGKIVLFCDGDER